MAFSGIGMGPLAGVDANEDVLGFGGHGPPVAGGEAMIVGGDFFQEGNGGIEVAAI